MDQGQALLDALGESDGFKGTGVECREGDPDEIHVSLQPKEDAPLNCNCCGPACERIHEHVQRTVRDLPLFDAITYLEITIYRIWFEHCSGAKRMRIDWLSDQQRVTNRLAESVIYPCSRLSIQHVAKFYRLHWHTVKRTGAAVMDMHPAFTLKVEWHCPNAAIVYDLFHVIAKYSP
jgi:transposase